MSQLPISSAELTIKSLRASLSVAISTPNEAMYLLWAIRRMPSYVDEVVIAGGRSHDHTADVARAVRVDVVVVDEQRKGRGAAAGVGFAAASGGIIVMLDADGSMDPQESAGVSPRSSMATTSSRSRVMPPGRGPGPKEFPRRRSVRWWAASGPGTGTPVKPSLAGRAGGAVDRHRQNFTN